MVHQLTNIAMSGNIYRHSVAILSNEINKIERIPMVLYYSCVCMAPSFYLIFSNELILSTNVKKKKKNDNIFYACPSFGLFMFNLVLFVCLDCNITR